MALDFIHRPWPLACAALLLSAWCGCDHGAGPLEVTLLTRDCEALAQDGLYEVTVHGQGFAPAIHANFGCGNESLQADDEFELTLAGRPTPATRWQSSSQLVTRVSDEVASGTHDVILQGPGGVHFEGPVLYRRDCDEPATDTETQTASQSETGSGDTETPSESQSETESGDTETPSESQSETGSGDTETPSESQSETGSGDTETLSESQSETGSGDTDGTQTDAVDTDTQMSCTDFAALDPHIVCCPDLLPTSCDEGDWSWGGQPRDSAIGCCAGPNGDALRCAGSDLVVETCDPEALCVFVDGDNGHSCTANSCIGAIPIEFVTDPGSVEWQGQFSDYENTFNTSNTKCNNYGNDADIWFEVTVPVGRTVIITEIFGYANVNIRWIESCAVRTCLNAMDFFTYLQVMNPGPESTIHISVVPGLANLNDNVFVTFSLQP